MTFLGAILLVLYQFYRYKIDDVFRKKGVIFIQDTLLSNAFIDKIVVSFPKSHFNVDLIHSYNTYYNLGLYINKNKNYIKGCLFSNNQGIIKYYPKSNNFLLFFNPAKLEPEQEIITQEIVSKLQFKKINRVDIAVDCYFSLIDCDIINNKVWDTDTRIRKGKKQTLYFGSYTSDKQTVIYDKKAESPSDYKHLETINRLEIRLKNKRVNDLYAGKDLLKGFSITNLDLETKIKRQGGTLSELTILEKLEILEFVNNNYNLKNGFSAKDKRRLKEKIKKLKQENIKPLFDTVLEIDRPALIEKLNAYMVESIGYKAVA